jgi:hypothetical protein
LGTLAEGWEWDTAGLAGFVAGLCEMAGVAGLADEACEAAGLAGLLTAAVAGLLDEACDELALVGLFPPAAWLLGLVWFAFGWFISFNFLDALYLFPVGKENPSTSFHPV